MTGFWTKQDQEWWDNKENQFIYNFNQLFTSGDYWDRTPENVKPREEALRKLYRESIQVQAPVSPMLAEGNKVDCNNCYECLKDKTDGHGLPIPLTRMILCPICGNKRCPKATDHNLECTNSNESGQAGSRY